jgi:hypothetical protein
VGSGSRVISDPDTKVLNLGRSLLVDLVDRHDFTISLLDSSKSSQKVPKSRLSHHSVGGENSHSVEFWLRFDRRGQSSADNLIFIKSCH